jgi:hypothetical protein
MAARGHCAGGASMRRISVGFDDDTFAEIVTTADARGLKFLGERIRELVELGLETEKLGDSCCSNSPQKASSTSSRSPRRSP